MTQFDQSDPDKIANNISQEEVVQIEGFFENAFKDDVDTIREALTTELKSDPQLVKTKEFEVKNQELEAKNDELIKKNKEFEAKNDELIKKNKEYQAQDIAIKFEIQLLDLRKTLVDNIINLMYGETITLFLILILVGCNFLEKINHLTLQIFVGGTIIQISTMLIVIIKSVYSDSLNKIMMKLLPTNFKTKVQKSE